MASVVLGQADIALFADPGPTRVVIPYLTSMPRTRGRDKVFVRYLGDDYPTATRGKGRSGTFALSCRFGVHEHTDLLALLTLLDETAPSAPDSRLLLRTHIGLAAGLDAAVGVEVEGDITETPLGAGAVDVTFTVRIVQHSFEV